MPAIQKPIAFLNEETKSAEVIPEVIGDQQNGQQDEADAQQQVALDEKTLAAPLVNINNIHGHGGTDSQGDSQGAQNDENDEEPGIPRIDPQIQRADQIIDQVGLQEVRESR